MAGFPPEFWISLFQDSSEFFQPMLTWMNEVLCGSHWWNVSLAKAIIILNLGCCGLVEEFLVQQLQPFSQEQTGTFMR